ncbi:MAG: lysylphosphatidylglycerol synthase transmembrane domain-containing protein [Vicinamibacterales bacterium]
MPPWLRTAALALVMFALVAVFLRNANMAAVWQAVRTADPALLATGVACLFTSYGLRALRWRAMLVPLGPVPLALAYRATLIGFAASFVLPARAGEVLKPWIVARRQGFDATATFTTVVVERMLDLVTVLLLLGVFLSGFDPGLAARDAALFGAIRAGGVAAAAFAVVTMSVLLFLASRPALLPRLAAGLTGWLPARAREAVQALSAAVAAGLGSVRGPARLGRALAWSLPLWLVIAAQIWVVSRALGVAVPPAGSLLIMALLVVGVAVPTPGAVGGFHEAYRLGATAFFAADNDHAVGAAIVLHAVGFVPTLVAGAWMMAREGLSFAHLGAEVARAKDEEAHR